jgi:hypothetical protein
MPRKFWWPTSMPAQIVIVQNFQAKAPQYAAQLGYTAEQVDEICNAFLGAVNAAEQCRQTMVAMTAWRDQVLNGAPAGQPAPQAPVFPVVGTVAYPVGVIKMLFDLRDRIVLSPNYTEAIGEDLGIVGAQITPPQPPANIAPSFKSVTPASGYSVQIRGSMQGMDAMRVEYAPQGGSFRTVAFLTNTPASFNIVPADPGKPESGRLRAVYVRKNADFGRFSSEYPVTIS